MIKRSSRMDTRIEVALLNDSRKDVYDFFTLNISDSGMLIASNEFIRFQTDDSTSVLIDPYKKYMPSYISCDVIIARIVDSSSKGLQKYIALFGEPKDISTIIGVYYQNMSMHSKQMLSSFIYDKSLDHAA